MISVVVPVYNEGNAIAGVVDGIAAALEGFVTYEIILINDGSTDGTRDEVDRLEMENLTVIHHVENLGYGKSLYDGILSAKYDCIAIIDGDGSYPPEEIRELYRFYPQYDMVVGARKGQEYKKGLTKRFARVLFQALAEYATGRHIPDVNSGLRIFRKEIVQKYQDSLCTGFSFTTTITLLFMLNSYCVKYIPINYLKRAGKSKVKHLRDTLRAAQIIVEAVLYYNPVKLFLLIATMNTLFGVVLGILNYLTYKIDFVFTIASLLIASFAPIFCIGLISDQLKKIYNLRRDENQKAD